MYVHCWVILQLLDNSDGNCTYVVHSVRGSWSMNASTVQELRVPHQAEQRGGTVCNIHSVVTVVTLFPGACNSNYACTIYGWSGAAGAGVQWSKVTSTSPCIEVVWGRDGVPGPCGPQGRHARNLKPGQRVWLGSRVVYLVKTCLGQSYCAWAT